MLAYFAQENTKFNDVLFPFEISERIMDKSYYAKDICKKADNKQPRLMDSTSNIIHLDEQACKNDNSIADKFQIPNKDDLPSFWIKYMKNNYYFHFHYFCQLVYVRKGKILYFINNQYVEGNEGETLLINEKCPHTWIAIKNTEVIIATFFPSVFSVEAFSSNYSSSFEMLFGEQFSHLIFKDDTCKKDRIASLMQQMLEEYAECRLGYKMLIAMKLFEISIIAIRDVLKLPYAKKEESHKHHVLERAIIYIKENFAEDIACTGIKCLFADGIA